MESLLELFGEELTTEALKYLKKQRRQLEDEAEAGQQPTAPQTKEMTNDILQGFHGLLHQTMDYIENMDPDFERSGLKRRQVMEIMAYYEDLLSEKRRKRMQSTPGPIFQEEILPPSGFCQR